MSEVKEVKDPMDTTEEEIKEAKKEAKEASKKVDFSIFTLPLKKPFVWEGVEYTSLDFDFNGLTGNDFINIEDEVNAEGYSVVAAEFSTIFQMIMAMRCCKQPIGTDAIRKLPFALFIRIKNRARSFLLNQEI